MNFQNFDNCVRVSIESLRLGENEHEQSNRQRSYTIGPSRSIESKNSRMNKHSVIVNRQSHRLVSEKILKCSDLESAHRLGAAVASAT